MYGDIKLKIRHAKRGNEKSLDLSGMGLSDLPIDITQLTMLESINLSNNKLQNLKRIEQLPNLREINASNNQINQLHQEMLDMFSIETLQLYGNPIVNSNPQLAQIENNQGQLKRALQQYFGVASSGLQGIQSSTGMGLGSGVGNYSSNIPSQGQFGSGGTGGLGLASQNSYGMQSTAVLGSSASYGGAAFPSGGRSSMSNFQGSTGAVGGAIGQPTFLGSSDNTDTMALKRKIAMLEQENKTLRDNEKKQLEESMKKSSITNDDRNWMSSFGGGAPAQGRGMTQVERPVTASSQNARVREVQEELKNERKEKKKLIDQIEGLKSEIQKQNFSAFTQAANVSVTSGRLPPVPGVREVTIQDLELGEKIAQGGFSVIHKGKLNGTPVAIKKIFDPRLTDELLQEIQNEIVMQSILRHPNIAILMGVIPKIPDIYIVFEHVSQGSLYDMLHMKKKTIDLSTKERIRIARDAATVFEYMHHLGIVHRDIKSHNVLIDSSFHVKVCDFGLAKFNADIGKGSMQFAGTPTYMAPELFQKRTYDQSVDVFAFGCLLWEIINREVPNDGLDPSDIAQKVIQGEKLKDHNLSQIDVRLADLVNTSRAVDPNQRPSFKTIVEVLNDVMSNM